VIGADDAGARISEELRALKARNIDSLRAEWRRRFAAPPPALRGPDRMRRALFRPGTILVREHQDKTHRVEVLEQGFRWEGETYASLSVIARAITGVRWNGPRFFGLREPSKSGAAR